MRSYLDDCQKIEQAMGDVYRKLAEFRPYSDKLRSIFERMARDEDDHARQLEVAKGVPEEIFFDGTRIDPEKVDSLLRRTHQFLRVAKNPPRSESLMLETARDLERDFLAIHLQNAVRFKAAGMAELFQKMAREDRNHLETLDSYYREKKKTSPFPYH